LIDREKTWRRKTVLVSGNTVADRIHLLSRDLSEDAKYVFPSQDGNTAAAVAKRHGLDLSQAPDVLIPGGQGATPADFLATRNKVFFVGPIGNNDDAAFIEKDFKANGIDTSYAPRCDAEHFRADVFVGTNATRLILMYKDPNLRCDDVALDWIEREKPDVIYLDGNEPALALRLAQKGKAFGIPVVCDLEDLNKPLEFLDYVDVLIAPAKVMKELGKTDDIEEALQSVSDRGFAAVVSTQGERGCVGVCGKELVRLDRVKVDVKDTTGAGDTFHAAFVDAMLSGCGFYECMEFANRLAALNCTFVGGRMPKDFIRGEMPPQSGGLFDPLIWLGLRPSVKLEVLGGDYHL